MNRKQSFYLVLILVLIGGGMGVFYWLKQPPSIRPKKELILNSDVNLNATLAFHPDEVLRIEWLQGNKQYKYLRQYQQTSWQPSVDNQNLQDRLNLLARIHTRKINSDGKSGNKPLQKYKVFLKDGSHWVAEFDGQKVVWVSGPHSSFGTLLSEPQKLILESLISEGRPQAIKLCPEKIVGLSLKEKAVSFIFRELQWQRIPPVNNPGTFVEEWLAKYCTIIPDAIYEAKIISSSKKSETLSLTGRSLHRIDVEVYFDPQSKLQIYSVKLGKKKVFFGSGRMLNALGELEGFGNSK